MKNIFINLVLKKGGLVSAHKVQKPVKYTPYCKNMLPLMKAAQDGNGKRRRKEGKKRE